MPAVRPAGFHASRFALASPHRTTPTIEYVLLILRLYVKIQHFVGIVNTLRLKYYVFLNTFC